MSQKRMEPHFCDIKIQFLWKNPIFVEKLEALCCFSLAVGSAWSTQSSMGIRESMWDDSSVVGCST